MVISDRSVCKVWGENTEEEMEGEKTCCLIPLYESGLDLVLVAGKSIMF